MSSIEININKSGTEYIWKYRGNKKTYKADNGLNPTYLKSNNNVVYLKKNKRPQTNYLTKSDSMERYNLEFSDSYSVVDGNVNALSAL